MKLKLENTQINDPITAVDQEPKWLASVLVHRGERITRRFAYFYEKLQALPRPTRKTLQKRLAMTLAGAALLLALSGAPSVHAASITVNTNGGVLVDGKCSLVEAIIAANTDAAYDGCASGAAGLDTITFAGSGASYLLYSEYSGSGNALPLINTDITIDGGTLGTKISLSSVASIRILQVGYGATLTLNNVTLSGGNALTSSGGAIYNDGGVVNINNSTISGNAALKGGGVYNTNGGVMVLTNTTVSGNEAIGDGAAGIFNFAQGLDATITLNNSQVSGNLSSGAASQGGGVYNWGDLGGVATVNINNSVISGNLADGNGGGIVNYGSRSGSGVLNIDSSTISGNFANADLAAAGNGGAVFNVGLAPNGTAEVTLTNSTISNNYADSGAGVFSDRGAVTIIHSTIAKNVADIGSVGGVVGTASIKNSIIAEQVAGLDCGGGVVTSQGYNIDSDNSCSLSLALQDKPGVTPTELLLEPLLGEFPTDQKIHPPTHALGNGSVAIDLIPDGTNGCDGLLNTSTSVDQRGAARAQGLNKGGGACDIGAFEYASPNSPTAVSLQSFTVTGGSESGLAPALLGLLTSAGLGGLWWRKRRSEQPDKG